MTSSFVLLTLKRYLDFSLLLTIFTPHMNFYVISFLICKTRWRTATCWPCNINLWHSSLFIPYTWNRRRKFMILFLHNFTKFARSFMCSSIPPCLRQLTTTSAIKTGPRVTLQMYVCMYVCMYFIRQRTIQQRHCKNSSRQDSQAIKRLRLP